MAQVGLWAVVLAGGEGTRLAPLIRELHGSTVPKQFAVLIGGESLLQSTIERIRALVPLSRTVVVVAREFESLARAQLGPYPGIEIIVQPRNLGTAPGLLLPLARIRLRDPDAVVAVFPSDHYVPRPEPLLRAVVAAAGAAREHGALALLGVAPDQAEPEYGWILPERPARVPPAGRAGRWIARMKGTATPVRRFVEKPDRSSARRLLRRGALWNTFISVGRLSTYWKLASRFLPQQIALFERYLGSLGTWSGSRALESAYVRMAPADFSRSVLEPGHRLLVVPVRDSGWSDWGSPDRVGRSLAEACGDRGLGERTIAACRRLGGPAASPSRVTGIGHRLR